MRSRGAALNRLDSSYRCNIHTSGTFVSCVFWCIFNGTAQSLCKLLIWRTAALNVNTSPRRQKMKERPDEEVWSMARERKWNEISRRKQEEVQKRQTQSCWWRQEKSLQKKFECVKKTKLCLAHACSFACCTITHHNNSPLVLCDNIKGQDVL